MANHEERMLGKGEKFALVLVSTFFLLILLTVVLNPAEGFLGTLNIIFHYLVDDFKTFSWRTLGIIVVIFGGLMIVQALAEKLDKIIELLESLNSKNDN